jgi:hypothetical protein
MILNLEEIKKEAANVEVYNGERWVFLGSVFSLTPSGKYYMPYACSNLDLCPHCGGTGVRHKSGKNRIWKKKRARLYDTFRKARKRNLPVEETLRVRLIKERLASDPTESCIHCGGMGSMEAYQDELWHEEVQAELVSIGGYLCSGEGDATDLFAVFPDEGGEGDENDESDEED